jgi:protein gp37
MGDLFHEDIPDRFIAAVFGVMAATPQHVYHLLTKRPEQTLKWFEWIQRIEGSYQIGAEFRCAQAAFDYGAEVDPREEFEFPPPNVRMGTSIEDQPSANERVPALLKIPAACHFVSVEPMLSDIDLRSLPANVPQDPFRHPGFFDYFSALTGEGHNSQRLEWHFPGMYPSLDWVIAGAEGGPGRRVPNMGERGAFHHLLGQCLPAKVPFFLKSMSFDGEVFSVPRLQGRQWLQFPGDCDG